MKNFKLNIALLVAVMTIGGTISTKANLFGKRIITLCFTELQLKDASGLTYNLHAPFPTCLSAQQEAFLKPIVNSAFVFTALQNPSICTSNIRFCCARVTEIASFDPLYASAPFIDLGEGLRKYRVYPIDIFCRPF